LAKKVERTGENLENTDDNNSNTKSFPMRGLLLNCRGVRKKGVASFIRHLISQYKFQFIGIQETMVVDCNDFITRKLDPSCDYLWLWSPPKGKSGGILVGSRTDDLDVGTFIKGKHILQVSYWDKALFCKWNQMVVYGPTHERYKDMFLKEFDEFYDNSNEPYIVGGDFNIIRFSYEKNREHALHKHSGPFHDMVQKHNLMEIYMASGGFTWSNNHESPTMVKLDRALMSTSWENIFPVGKIKKLPKNLLDHNPLTVESEMLVKSSQSSLFFEIEWLSHPYFKKILE
jgi:exonuclease III